MEKIYCNKSSAKKKEFNNGGYIINAMLDLDELEEHFKSYGFTTKENRRKLKVSIGTRREPDQFGNTHNIEVDTWKPDGNSNSGNSGSFQSASKPQQAGNNGFAPYKPPSSVDPDKFEDDTIPF